MNRIVKHRIKILLIVVISITGILLALPREQRFGYEYSLGQPWRYAPLIATYEFPIHMSDEQREMKRDSVLREFHPYFQLRTEIGRQAVEHFKSDYVRGAFVGVPERYVYQMAGLLQEVYSTGVMDHARMDTLAAQRYRGIRVLSGTSATTLPLATLFSPGTAYEYIQRRAEFPGDVVQRLNLNRYLTPNLLFDSIKTQLEVEEALSVLNTNVGMVLAGERIIDRGERVSLRQVSILDSLRKESERRKDDGRSALFILIGQAGVVIAFIGMLLYFLHLFRREVFADIHSVALIFTLITLFSVATSLLVAHKFFSVYIIPFAMVPIIVRIFMDTRTAFIVAITLAVIASLPLHTNYQFLLTQIVASLVALYTIKELTSRAQIINAAFIIVLATWAFGLCFELAQGSDFGTLEWEWYWYIGLNGILLLFTYPLLYLIELSFGFTSSVTLVEMSNVNTPLLRMMAKKAHGTFVHSLQVGNLAAEVADKIGARVQLVRTAALYHDLGKTLNPAYFTENQGGGINPHDKLTEQESAAIIISHVTDGMRLAEKYRIPKLLRDFIVTHHGCSMVKYFYIQACNRCGAENVDAATFTYPGPNPQTREQAILMMADAVEASSRSLKEYSDATITELVHRIVDGQLEAGCFKECPITFKDIADAKQVLAESLKTTYHTRIAYPTLHTTSESEEAAPTERIGLFGNSWTWKR